MAIDLYLLFLFFLEPEMVKNLTADNITITSLLLSWEKPETNVSFYYIQILQDPNFIRNTSTTYFTVENLTPGNNYTFLVIAVAGMVEGNVSQISAYTRKCLWENQSRTILK